MLNTDEMYKNTDEIPNLFQKIDERHFLIVIKF